jgi:hypothetical protein
LLDDNFVPLGTIKTRIQTEDTRGVIFSNLFSGIVPALIHSAIEKGAYFYVYFSLVQSEATILPQSKAQVQMLLTRFCLATRLNCLAHYLSTAISQPAPGSIDELLIATMAGCAREISSANLTAVVQGRTLLAIRYGGTLTGRYVSSCPAYQLRGDRWSRRARDLILTRGANSAAGAHMPLPARALETGIAVDVDLNNTAHTDPAIRVLMLSSTCGGRPPALSEVMRGWRRLGLMERGLGAQIAPMGDLSDLSPVADMSCTFSEGLEGRAFLTACRARGSPDD